MLALYLLAAHLVGDFFLQSRTMALLKLEDPWVRFRHVLAYGLAFVPLVAWVTWDMAAWRPLGFMAALGALHFATDSRRLRSNLMDWIEWRVQGDERPRNVDHNWRHPVFEPLPPNPWGPLPIVLDQTLHVVQLAVLGGVFLA